MVIAVTVMYTYLNIYVSVAHWPLLLTFVWPAQFYILHREYNFCDFDVLLFLFTITFYMTFLMLGWRIRLLSASVNDLWIKSESNEVLKLINLWDFFVYRSITDVINCILHPITYNNILNLYFILLTCILCSTHDCQFRLW